jgi:hypothetical protein
MSHQGGGIRAEIVSPLPILPDRLCRNRKYRGRDSRAPKI